MYPESMSNGTTPWIDHNPTFANSNPDTDTAAWLMAADGTCWGSTRNRISPWGGCISRSFDVDFVATSTAYSTRPNPTKCNPNPGTCTLVRRIYARWYYLASIPLEVIRIPHIRTLTLALVPERVDGGISCRRSIRERVNERYIVILKDLIWSRYCESHEYCSLKHPNPTLPNPNPDTRTAGYRMEGDGRWGRWWLLCRSSISWVSWDSAGIP